MGADVYTSNPMIQSCLMCIPLKSSTQFKLEGLRAIACFLVQRPGQGEAERSETGNPCYGHTCAVPQFTIVGTQTKRADWQAIRIKHIASISEQDGSKLSPVLDKRQREQDLRRTIDQKVSANGILTPEPVER